ncbi:MAG: TetR/AcrR family transcriptional regulator [Acidobacteria bacterium]|nr:TetR/AcrR family transcriptional regulator [Acidobacteriota bacterium]
MVNKKPERPRDAQREATAHRILASALRLFDRLGFEHTSVDKIVEDAGVAKGTFFHHFPSKDAILAWIGDQQIANLQSAIAARRGFSQLSFEKQIRFVLLTLGEAHAKRKSLIKFLAAALLKTDLLSGPHSKGMSQLDAVLLPLIRKAQHSGEVRAEISAETIASFIRATYFHSILEWLIKENRSFEQVLEPFLQLIIRGTKGD